VATSDPTPGRRWAKPVFWFAIAHFVAWSALAGTIFLLSHIPPKAVNLDTLILGLVRVEDVFVYPRKWILAGWPGERTPSLLPLCATVLNSIVWGAVLAGVRAVSSR